MSNNVYTLKAATKGFPSKNWRPFRPSIITQSQQQYLNEAQQQYFHYSQQQQQQQHHHQHHHQQHPSLYFSPENTLQHQHYQDFLAFQQQQKHPYQDPYLHLPHYPVIPVTPSVNATCNPDILHQQALHAQQHNNREIQSNSKRKIHFAGARFYKTEKQKNIFSSNVVFSSNSTSTMSNTTQSIHTETMSESEFAVSMNREKKTSLGFMSPSEGMKHKEKHHKMEHRQTENIHFIHSSYSTEFHQEYEIIAQKLRDEADLIPDPDADIRKDLRHLTVYAIDKIEVTDEVDDAISLQIDQDGTEKIYIHISDATRYISFDSKIYQLALERVSSIYLPELKIPMLPRALSVDLLSLSEKKENYALTFTARVLPGGELSDYAIFPSIISKVHRLDYDILDQVFENNATVPQNTYESMKRMLDIANVRLRYRAKRGASLFNTPKTEVYVNSEGQVTVEPSREFNSNSRRLVQELMIIANEISAKFADKNQICVPFRGTLGSASHLQANTESQILDIDMDMSESKLASLILADYQRTNKMTPGACFTQIPCFHEGIGIDGYAQATSPIRRCTDLLLHYQVKACLRGEKPPLTWQNLQSILSRLELKSRMIQNLQKNSIQFWLYKYFEENMNTERNTYKALVLECNNENYGLLSEFATSSYLVDVGFRTKVKTYRTLKPGDIFYCRVTKVNPSQNILQMVEEVPQ